MLTGEMRTMEGKEGEVKELIVRGIGCTSKINMVFIFTNETVLFTLLRYCTALLPPSKKNPNMTLCYLR